MEETVADLGEFALIERITAEARRGPQIVVGPGDDAAVLSVDGQVVVSTDVYVEHVHFRTDWTSAGDVGHRGVGGATADIEAMGAVPTAVLIGLTVPKTTPLRWVDQCFDGILAEADTAGLSLAGGDVTAGANLALAVTVIGETRGRAPIQRGGAQVGDAVAYRGRLGWAAAGLAVLTRGFRSPRAVVDAYRRPQVPYGAGAEAAKWGATALIDVSDGLIADLNHVAQASRVVIDLDHGRFDWPDILVTVAGATGKQPEDFVLAGGEDHALVATFPWGQVPALWQVIGRVDAPGNRDPGVTVDGDAWAGELGWTHF